MKANIFLFSFIFGIFVISNVDGNNSTKTIKCFKCLSQTIDPKDSCVKGDVELMKTVDCISPNQCVKAEGFHKGLQETIEIFERGCSIKNADVCKSSNNNIKCSFCEGSLCNGSEILKTNYIIGIFAIFVVVFNVAAQ